MILTLPRIECGVFLVRRDDLPLYPHRYSSRGHLSPSVRFSEERPVAVCPTVRSCACCRADRLRPRGRDAPSEEALRCLSARVAHAQFETRVLLPKGTIDLGTQRNTLELSSVQKLMKSIALYRMDVNMVVLWHDRKETTNGHDNPLRRAGSESDCGDQRASWRDLRQCGYSACTAHDVQREQAAVHPAQSPNKVGPFIPALERTGLSGPFTVSILR